MGLIGASIGLALRKSGHAGRIVGIGRRPDRLERAVELGAIDDYLVGAGPTLRDVDLLVLCVPVDQIVDRGVECEGFLSDQAVLTDAGSTKGRLVAEMDRRLILPSRFLGSHPIAGSEKTGAEAARADLYQDRTCVLTPTHQTAPSTVETVRQFWRRLGMNVVEMSADDHDRALALTSHLPHLVSSALSSAVDPRYHGQAGTGLRDASRLAAGDPQLWTAILSDNRDHVLAAIDAFEQRLRELRQAIEDRGHSQLEASLARGKRHRDNLGS